jgi:hypothetical protein
MTQGNTMNYQFQVVLMILIRCSYRSFKTVPITPKLGAENNPLLGTDYSYNSGEGR